MGGLESVENPQSQIRKSCQSCQSCLNMVKCSPMDYAAHNAEVQAVWEAYRAHRPTRVPFILGINTRYTMANPEANPRGLTYEQCFNDPQLMLERQLEHQHWIRLHVPQDADMGLPEKGWAVGVEFQNVYEAAWLGCPVQFHQGEVPDTQPILADEERKNLLFEQGVPDPFGGFMGRVWEFYDYFKAQQAAGYTYLGLPIASVGPCGMGTDGPLTVACNVRGASEFIMDLVADEDYALRLLDFLTEAAISRLQAYRQRLDEPQQTQSWGFADDSVQLISEKMYQEMIFPFHQRLVDTFSLGGPNSIHLCGNSTRHFPFLRDHLNIQSFDTGFPVDFTWLRQTLGPEVEIYGGPSVPFLQQAQPPEVEQETRRVLESGIMEGGRFVLREGNNLAPGIGVPQLEAMYRTVKKFGRYSPV